MSGAEVAEVASAAERFEALFAAFYGDLMAYAIRRCPSRQDAEDVVAETFAVTWRRLDDLPKGDQARLWLFGTARLVHMNQSRGRRRRRSLVARLQGLPLPGRATTADPDPAERELVLQALRQLPASDREVLQLHAWEQLSGDEIAVVLDISPAAVWKRLQRARDRLAALLAESVTPEPVAIPLPPGGRTTRKAQP